MNESFDNKVEESVSLEKETGITEVVLNKINNNPVLKKAFLALVMTVGLMGAVNAQDKSKEVGNDKKNKIELGKEGKTFSENYILQDEIREFVNLIKTGNLVEKGDHYFVSQQIIEDILKKYPNGREEYSKALNDKKEEINLTNNKIDDDFIKNTPNVTNGEVKKVYDFLESKMDVWNMSDIRSFSDNLEIVFNLVRGHDPRVKESYYTKNQLKNLQITARTYLWGDGNTFNKEQEKNHEDESAMLYNSIKNLLK